MTVPLVKPQNGIGRRSAGSNEKGVIKGKTHEEYFLWGDRISQEKMGV